MSPVQTELSPAAVLALYPAHSDTIPSFLATRRSVAGDRCALQFESRVWTYSEVDDASTAMAQKLARGGCAKGDRIALISVNTDSSVLVFLAAAKLGAMFVPLNPQATDEDLAYLLRHSHAATVICQPADLARVRTIVDSVVDSMANSIDPPPRLLDIVDLMASLTTNAITALGDESSSASLPPVNPDDPVVVIYTSGTTGFPKGVVHTHRSYVLAAEAFVARQYLQPADRLLALLPFFHINALFYSLGGAIAAGSTLITARGFSASAFWHLAAETRATQFNFLAAVGNILTKRPRSEFNGAHCIVKIYGGPMSEEMFNVFRQEFHVSTLIDGYGMTEIPGTSANPFLGPHKSGSIGRPAVHPRFSGDFVAMRVEDDNGKELPSGAVGELVVKTPILFKEYLDDPAHTTAAFRNGWFLTGDLVRKDGDGYFFFVARRKDIIRRRGENISGAELDRVISGHPDLLEAAAIGVPAELGEEEILVVVVAKPGAHPRPQDIIEWCRGKLAPMKIPRFIAFAESLPHTPSHRVAKHRLKEDPQLLGRAFDALRPG
jgi:carnitine-CoA ligase